MYMKIQAAVSIVVLLTGMSVQAAEYNGTYYEHAEETDLSITEPVVVAGTLYVPRSYRIKNEKKPGVVSRVLGRAMKNASTEVEHSISNGIDRQIYEIGKKIDEARGTY